MIDCKTEGPKGPWKSIVFGATHQKSGKGNLTLETQQPEGFFRRGGTRGIDKSKGEAGGAIGKHIKVWYPTPLGGGRGWIVGKGE